MFLSTGDRVLQLQAGAGPGQEGARAVGARGAGRHQADGHAVPEGEANGKDFHTLVIPLSTALLD